ncbi:MAG: cysteine desulfurase, SufS subfamily [bacterium F082]|nr:MAG: cysteine desulfurase, SufS subfamily [bacterium F082]KWW30570.1 MAG: cysteine desulfurase, SufS subfamily [bacterium P201]
MNINEIREQFPVLDQQVYGKPLVYLDNAATTQKPLCVIERERDYYLHENCNIHRGVHYLSQKATEAYEHARQTVADFVHAKEAREIIFTRGTTESLNLLATSFEHLLLFSTPNSQLTTDSQLSTLNSQLKVLVTSMEHHSNLVPWQQMVQRHQGQLLVVPMDDKGVLDLNRYEELLKEGPKVVSIAHISNVLGTINPVKEMVAMAHHYGIPVVVDGAQSIAHHPIDVQDLDCDFFVFSGHKMYAPMGIGGLYGKAEWLEELPPYQFGGEMVDTVSFEKTTFNVLPYKFEAGTPNVGAALGLETAVQFMQGLDRNEVEKHESQLLQSAIEKLSEIDGIRFIGEAAHRSGLVSFIIDGIHPYDLGTIIDKMGVAVRTGHHCAEPVMTRFGIPGTVRASFALYNTMDEVEVFVNAVKKAVMMLR